MADGILIIYFEDITHNEYHFSGQFHGILTGFDARGCAFRDDKLDRFWRPVVAVFDDIQWAERLGAAWTTLDTVTAASHRTSVIIDLASAAGFSRVRLRDS